MRKIILAAAIALPLTACGTEKVVYVDSADTVPAEEPAEEPVETTAAPTTTQAPTPATRPTLPPEPEEPAMNGYQEDVYLRMVRENTPYWYYSYTNDNLVGLAIAICDELDAGTPVDRQLVNLMIMAEDVDPALNDDIGLFMRYVVRYVCPEHFYQIEALNNT